MDDIAINKKEDNYFRIVKLWQTRDFELILSLIGYDKKKCFLKITPLAMKFQLELLSIKPEFEPVSGNFVEIFRKYIPSSIILKCIKIKKDIYIFLQSSSSIYIVVLWSNLEYELLSYDLSSNECISFLRWGKKSTYTKKKVIDLDFNIKDILSKDDSGSSGKYDELDLLSYRKDNKNIENKNKNEDKDKDDDQNKNQISLSLRVLLQRLKRKKKTLLKSLEKLKSKTITEKELEELRKKAFNMKDNFWSIRQLDPTISGKDIEKVFNEYKKKEKNLSIGSSHIKELNSNIERLDTVIKDIELGHEVDVTSIEKEFSLSKIQTVRNISGNRVQKSSFYRKFKLDKYIYVGKDAKTNDELTKSLKSNDYWFHIVGSTGSHVAIKNDKKELSSTLIRQACILALFFSESRSQEGSVYFCKKLDLKKTTTVGLWKVIRSKTLDISYKKEEIDDILSKEEK